MMEVVHPNGKVPILRVFIIKMYIAKTIEAMDRINPRNRTNLNGKNEYPKIPSMK